jgi:hypothetical protein
MMLGQPLTTWIDAVIGFTVLEMLLLVIYRRATGRGLAAEEFVANMLSGLCLMLALRALASGAAAAWIVLPLMASGLAHAADLWRRLRQGGAVASSQAAPTSPNGNAATSSPLVRVPQVHP